jgi:hypothetical protein
MKSRPIKIKMKNDNNNNNNELVVKGGSLWGYQWREDRERSTLYINTCIHSKIT